MPAGRHQKYECTPIDRLVYVRNQQRARPSLNARPVTLPPGLPFRLEIPQQSIECCLIRVMILPASEVTDVAAAELRRPAARCVEHGVVEPDREEHRAALLDLAVQRRADLEIDPAARNRRLGLAVLSRTDVS
jgi:hypothetical protein